MIYGFFHTCCCCCCRYPYNEALFEPIISQQSNNQTTAWGVWTIRGEQTATATLIEPSTRIGTTTPSYLDSTAHPAQRSALLSVQPPKCAAGQGVGEQRRRSRVHHVDIGIQRDRKALAVGGVA